MKKHYSHSTKVNRRGQENTIFWQTAANFRPNGSLVLKIIQKLCHSITPNGDFLHRMLYFWETTFRQKKFQQANIRGQYLPLPLAMTMFTVLSSWHSRLRVHRVHLMNAAQRRVAANLWTKPIGLCYHYIKPPRIHISQASKHSDC